MPQNQGMKTFELRPVLYFVLLSYGLAWLLALPLWLGGGIAHPALVPIAVAMMWVPGLAAALVSRATEPGTSVACALGLANWRPLRRTMWFCLFATLAAMAMCAASLLAAAALGLYHFDVQHFSGFAEVLDAKFAGQQDRLAKLPPLPVLAWLYVLGVLVAAPVNAIAGLGEELGWRGWLLPKLMPLGTAPAVIASGVIWALWHAPVILLGYNYPGVPGALSLACMTAMCIVVGAVFAWFRLQSGSVWPAALGHGAFNATAGFHLVFGAAGQKIDVTQATVLGWSGWIFPLLLAFVLFKIFPKNPWPAQETLTKTT